jgi:bud site selection protein 31
VRAIVSFDLTFCWAATAHTLTLPPAGSRYIYDLYYEKEAISKQLYDWLLKNNYADGNLIAKWKKQGYEKLCCLRCIQTKETNFNSTCICRVPREQLKEDQEVQCVNCGCRGCSSGD